MNRMKLGVIMTLIGCVGLMYSFGIFYSIQQGAYATLGMYPMSVKSPEEKISPTLVGKIKAGGTIPVVVSLTAETGELAIAQQMGVVPRLSAVGLQVFGRTAYTSNTVFGIISADKVDELASNPYVDEVLYDGEFFHLSSDSNAAGSANVGQIEAPEAWNDGYRGQGVVVIVIDSGIQNDHPWLIRNGVSLVLKEYPVCCQADYTHWHGTHVAGIIASQNPLHSGVAPGIKGFVDIVTFDYNGGAKLSWILESLDKAYEVAKEYRSQGIPVVSTNSWGGESADTPEINKVREAAMKLAGIIPVVFAAGNSGPNSGTIAAPGDADDGKNEVITVGAVDSSNNIAAFSSRGPDRWGGEHNEPDVVAPGVNIVSSIPGGSSSESGTSMATPHVAGVIALMLSKNPNLGNEQCLRILESTAKDLGSGGFDYAYGYGLVQAKRAIDEVSSIVVPVTPVTNLSETNDVIRVSSIIVMMLGAVVVLWDRRINKI